MAVKVTPEKRENMIEDRKKGATYQQIMNKYQVSKWTCITYLKDIPVDKSWLETEWRKAEKEAGTVLKKLGFSHIVNLNEICSNSPYWDYYCEWGDDQWLIDVTINQNKNLVDKALRKIEGYNIAVLLKTDNNWDLMEIKLNKLKSI